MKSTRLTKTTTTTTVLVVAIAASLLLVATAPAAFAGPGDPLKGIKMGSAEVPTELDEKFSQAFETITTATTETPRSVIPQELLSDEGNDGSLTSSIITGTSTGAWKTKGKS